ncbi:TfoX/Sxy family protein [Marinicellulosiphila megalodicopiae]|uniref:TfoX/Sxy family protein n=1 Tax=Marinicellulosiphila megalodicopiae TaxID=2724896 RepID=UPI003BAEE2CD
MAYDEALAIRITEYLQHRPELTIKKMFGGYCYMLNHHMCCGIVKDQLMGRVGPIFYEEALSKPHVSEMDFTKKSMKGMVYVSPQGIKKDSDLHFWIDQCSDFALSLPPKKSKPAKTKNGN